MRHASLRLPKHSNKGHSKKKSSKLTWQESLERMHAQSKMIYAQLETSIEDLANKEVLTEEEYQSALHFLNFEEEQKVEEDRSKVKKLKSEFKIDPNSTQTLITQILKANPNGLHINSIIDELAKLGRVSKSKYHYYSHISSLLHKYYYVFEKVGKATFKLRIPITINAIQKKKTALVSKSPLTIKQLALWAQKKYGDKFGRNPTDIKQLLNHIGIDCTTETVRRALKK